jgi:parallel beta-helix repeat protein
MKRGLLNTFIALAALILAVAACTDAEVIAPLSVDDQAAALSLGNACIDTGHGLTAKVLNQNVIDATIDPGDCDVGAFFDRRGVVQGATFVQPDPNPGPQVQYFVLVMGAHVDVIDSDFQAVEDFAHQMLHIGYRDRAAGRITGNELTGFKRAGILLDGEGTSAQVTGNTLVGVGPKSTGWAENGIQVSRGATGQIRDNVVTNHWWDLNNFCSSGIIAFESDNVTVAGNRVEGNDCGVILWGDRNNALHNQIVVEHEDATRSGNVDGTAGFDGLALVGDSNGARQNTISGHEDALSGILVIGTNSQLIRNFISGFSTAIDDFGDGTKLPPPFVPAY